MDQGCGRPLFQVLQKLQSPPVWTAASQVLRMIINAIPANALQETVEADIRTLPFALVGKRSQTVPPRQDSDFRIFVQQEL